MNDSDKVIGFIRGVVYAAGLINKFNMSAEQLLKEAGITEKEMKRYADEYDLENLGLKKEVTK